MVQRPRQRVALRHTPSASSPRAPPPPLRLVAACVSTIPLWFPSAARDLLVPLYSHAPVHSVAGSLPFYALAVGALVALIRIRRTGSGLRRPRSNWRTCWLVIGIYKICTEYIVRWNYGRLLTWAGSSSTGVWTGRLLLECVPTLCIWLWLLDAFTCKERQSFLPRAFLPLAYLASLAPPLPGVLPSKFPILPECYILQAHGLLLCLVALAVPRTYDAYQPRIQRARPALESHPAARLTLFALIALLAHVVALGSAHCPSSAFGDNALIPGVLAAKKSVTGWITVGEHTMPSTGGPGDLTFRYLRADHSLLGGLWVGPSREQLQRRGTGPAQVDEREVVRRAESIYSTFILQELVRLVPAPNHLPRQSPEQGLIIGLGAGLSARALAQHGVNLTLVEIDPVVYQFARDYFGVDDVEAGEVVLEDAVRWVEKQPPANQGGKLFDYIIHDVFTGGAVPSSLFTVPFLSRLADLLHPSGVLALNFAGTLSSPSSRAILHTVLHVFTASTSGSGHCRAIEDVPRTPDGPLRPDGPDAFRNLVVLCTKERSVPVRFRRPTRQDLLDFPSPGIRRIVFGTFTEQEVDLGKVLEHEGEDEVLPRLIHSPEDAAWVEREQLPEVRLHWAAMRQVLPAEIWARW